MRLVEPSASLSPFLCFWQLPAANPKPGPGLTHSRAQGSSSRIVFSGALGSRQGVPGLVSGIMGHETQVRRPDLARCLPQPENLLLMYSLAGDLHGFP